MTDFDNKLQYLENVFTKTTIICQNKIIDSLSFCKTPIKLLNHLIPSLYEKQNIVKTLMGHNYKRNKRALFNGIGVAFKSLFGTMDFNDAEYYDQAINKVNENEKHMISLIKQQIKVVQSTIHNFNSTIINIDKNKDIFNENFQKLYNITENLKDSHFNLELKQTIEEQFSFINLLLINLENQYNEIINAILFAKNNSLHPSVLTPSQLVKELSKTLPFLPTSTSYVFPLEDHNSYKFIDVLTITYYFFNNRIIFVISNPLVTTNNFNLYNLIPLPLINNTNEFLFIIPNINYLAVSEDKNLYTIFNNLNNCKTFFNITICKNHEPLYLAHSRPICELEILLQHSLSRSCDTRKLRGQFEIWHKLEKSNSWLFALPQPTDVTVSCINKDTESLTLNNTGIININPNCKVYTSTTTIISDNPNFETNINSVIPRIDLSKECCNENEKNKKQNKSNIFIPPIQAINLDKDSLKVASDKLDNLDKLADEYNSKFVLKNIVNNSYFSYMLLTLVKLFVCFVLYKLYKRWKRTPCGREITHGCQAITNTLTLNICKRPRPTNKNDTIELEICNDEPDSSSSLNENHTENKLDTPLRRSARLIKLKENF